MCSNKCVGKGERSRELVVVERLAGEVLEEDAVLFLINVERNACEAARFQCSNQCFGVHQRPRFTLMTMLPGFINLIVSARIMCLVSWASGACSEITSLLSSTVERSFFIFHSDLLCPFVVGEEVIGLSFQTHEESAQ